MTKYEILAISLQSVVIFIFLIGFAATVYQVRQLKNIHKDNHDWNRRLAAQQALQGYDYSEVSRALNIAFNFIDEHDSLPLSQITEKLDELDGLKMQLHQLLNFYEGLARGVAEGVFDEEVVKAARRGAMMRAEKSFRNYIDERRKITSQKAWCELTTLCHKWYNEEHSRDFRSVTGQ